MLLAGVDTWREIVRTPRKFTIPQTIIGAYTHAALPLTSNTQFSWLPNEALAIAANRFAYAADASVVGPAISPGHIPYRIPRIFQRHFDADEFDGLMDQKRHEAPYLYIEPLTYESLALPPSQQPRWHHELPQLLDHFFWQPYVPGARVRLLVLPEAEYVQGLLRPRDIIHSLRVTGPGWSLLQQSQVMDELNRVRSLIESP